jgi:hypothetical protein
MYSKRMSSKQLFLYLNICLFISLLMALGLLFFILPKSNYSDYEKRPLATVPPFSWQKFFFGKYIDSLDLYVADNFPFREQAVALNFQMKQYRGFHAEEVGFYNASVEMGAIVRDSLANEEAEEEEVEETGEATKSHGLMIYKGMAIQLFSGSPATAKSMAQVANYYAERLKGKARVMVAIAPTHGEFYLPQKYKIASEKANIDSLYAHLVPEIVRVDICKALRKHKKEYIYFNTDHHWTGLGAYYAYQAFCKAAGWEAVPLSSMERRVIPDFLGSLYWLTRDARLKENMDSIVYHKPPVSYQAYNCVGAGYKRIAPAFLFADFAKGQNAYSVYLGSDLPLMRIDTDVKNGKKIVVLKNSYGNPFVTYLIAHYEQVYIIDYRQYQGRLLSLIESEGINDVLIFHNTFSANTLPHINQIRQMLERGSTPIKQDKKLEPAPEAADSLARP